MMKTLEEFRAFATRGNVVDLAVGIIIGAAFTTIVNSLVSDILMPPISFVLGGIDFTNWFFQITGAEKFATLDAAQKAGVVTINYGLFINACIRFVIVAFAMFMIIKQFNRLKRQEEAKPVPPPRQEVLLEEIRDALRAKK